MLPFRALLMRKAVTPIVLGNSTDQGSNMALGGDQWRGYTFQAVSSGVINSVTVIGSSGGGTGLWKAVIYAATSASVISGAKLAETAEQTNLGVSESRTIPLVAGFSVTAGNWYALGIQCHPSSVMACRINTAANGRFFSDTYSDGALATAPASSNNGAASPFMWGIT